jgi:hypothetical protein
MSTAVFRIRIQIEIQAKSEQNVFRNKILFMFSSKKITFYKRYCLKYAFIHYITFLG